MSTPTCTHSPEAAKQPTRAACAGEAPEIADRGIRERALRVVCADDHVGFLTSVVETLERAGMRVVGVSATGRGAVEAIREVAPDVAVLDYRMPGLSGVEVARIVRDRFPATRIVILSAYADPELVELALQAGAAAFVSKDSQPEEIVKSVLHAASARTNESSR